MSAYDDILAQIKQKEEQINALSLDEEIRAQREKDKANMQADIDVSNAGFDSQISNTQAVFDKQIGDTKTAYESEYQKNAVQKLINEKQIAERNANLGLTDSGLNRTQQTAAQLSYANQKGDLDISRQKALDTLGLELTNAITTLQNQKASSERDIINRWNTYSDSIAQNTYNTKIGALVDEHNALIGQYNDMYKAQLDAEAKMRLAAIEASAKAKENENNITLWYYTGTYDEDKNPIFRNSEGKTQAFRKGINPYKGLMNNDVRDKDGNYDPRKAFSNGYQPNNIGGKALYAQEEYEVYVNGNKQKVWSYDDGKTLWAWDGSINEYVDVTSRRDELEKKG